MIHAGFKSPALRTREHCCGDLRRRSVRKLKVGSLQVNHSKVFGREALSWSLFMPSILQTSLGYLLVLLASSNAILSGDATFLRLLYLTQLVELEQHSLNVDLAVACEVLAFAQPGGGNVVSRLGLNGCPDALVDALSGVRHDSERCCERLLVKCFRDECMYR